MRHDHQHLSVDFLFAGPFSPLGLFFFIIIQPIPLGSILEYLNWEGDRVG